jgi:hypothetical protein
MNKTTFIFGIGAVVLVGILLVAYKLTSPNVSVPTSISPTVSEQNPGSSATNPVGQNTTTVPPISVSTTSSSLPTGIAIVANNGTTITTNDFIHNSATLADPSNAGNYYLSGSSLDGYAIGYRTQGQFFTIALEREPLGATRIAAENFLIAALGISENQLCNLKYYIGTDFHTNSFYAGKNLGFSFCPGAVVLPK